MRPSIDCLESLDLGDMSGVYTWKFGDLLALAVRPMRVVVVVSPGINQEATLIPASWMWIVVVVDTIRVHELTNVIGPDTSLIDPDREIVLVQAFIRKFGPAAEWWIEPSDVCVVCGPACQEIDARRTTPCYCAVVLLISNALVTDLASNVRHD